mmetsp:Transcript_115494/g.337844  ORF Transcript_115494/g.337844 Transcript_115494/m.337844 type:complete len:301 (+) Transcript_115494:811-1713(+)
MQVLRLALHLPLVLVPLAAFLDLNDAVLDPLELRVHLIPPLNRHLRVLLLHALHLLSEECGLVVAEGLLLSHEPLHPLLLCQHLPGILHLLLPELLVQLRHLVGVVCEPLLEPLLRFRALLLELIFRSLRSLGAHHHLLLKELLLPQLVLILFDQRAVLPQLALQITLHALCLFLKEGLQHGQELPTLDTRHLALLGVVRDDFGTLGQHLRQSLLPAPLEVVEPQLHLLLEVAGIGKGLLGPELQVLQHKAEPSAGLARPRRVQNLLRLDVLDCGSALRGDCIVRAGQGQRRPVGITHPP